MLSRSLLAPDSPLRKPDVARLFVAYLLSYTGSAMAPIAMAFGVLELTGSTKDAAIVIAAPTLASIVVLLVGGALADRLSRQKIMAIADTLAMLAQLSMAALFLTSNATVPLLTALMLANGIAIALNAPAATGLIVQLVDKNQLQATNALLGMARHGAVAGGAALGGLLVALYGAGITLAIDGLSFGLSALLVLSLKPKPQRPLAKASMIQDLVLGWREFTRHRWLWVIVLQFSLVVAGLEAVFGLLGPAVAREQMNGAADWGIIAGVFGLGMIIGGLLGVVVRPRYPMRFGSLWVFSFSLVPLALALALPVYAVAVCALISGIGGQLFSTLWNTTLQQRIPGELLSRVSAYDHLGSIALAPLGILLAGLLFELIGARDTLLLAAALIIVPTAGVLLVADVRQLQAPS
ncbi:MAG: putative MFS family arabinose efflux permease [Paraglaciecola psychrophila]